MQLVIQVKTKPMMSIFGCFDNLSMLLSWPRNTVNRCHMIFWTQVHYIAVIYWSTPHTHKILNPGPGINILGPRYIKPPFTFQLLSKKGGSKYYGHHILNPPLLFPILNGEGVQNNMVAKYWTLYLVRIGNRRGVNILRPWYFEPLSPIAIKIREMFNISWP